MPDDVRTSLVISSRLLTGWACAAVGVLNLSMGVDTTDQPYLLFHVVLLAGGLLLLGLGKLPKSPAPLGYGVIAVLAVIASVLAALPSTQNVCCLTAFDVRHGFPLTLAAWNTGQARHFAPAHAVADLVFWYLAGMIVLTLVTLVMPARRSSRPASSAPGAESGPGAAGAEADAAQADRPARMPSRASRAEDQPTHAEGRAGASRESAPVADDENVGGLP